MAAPTITRTGTGSSKTSGTSLVITVSTTSYAVGDYVAVGFSLDPASGAVSFAQTGGTATVGSWTTDGDRTNGSGTSGTREVFAHAEVTGAGTITQITVTHPTVTARSAEVFKISGADGTTPVQVSGVGLGGVNLTVATTGVDVLFLVCEASETTTGAATSNYGGSATAGTLVDVGHDTTTVGTTGGGAASNISSSYAAWSCTNIGSGTVTGSVGISSQDAAVGTLWQAPAGPVVLTPNRVITGMSQPVHRSTSW